MIVWRFIFETIYSNAADDDNIAGLLLLLSLPTTVLGCDGRNTIFSTSIGVGFGVGMTLGGKVIGDWVIGTGIDDDGPLLKKVGYGVVGAIIVGAILTGADDEV